MKNLDWTECRAGSGEIAISHGAVEAEQPLGLKAPEFPQPSAIFRRQYGGSPSKLASRCTWPTGRHDQETKIHDNTQQCSSHGEALARSAVGIAHAFVVIQIELRAPGEHGGARDRWLLKRRRRRT